MKYKINVLGSCVSRISLLNGNQHGHNIASENMELKYFLDKQNIACAMTSPPFSREEIDAISAEELWDKSRIHTVHQSLNKDTLRLLLEDAEPADYLIMDLFDFQNDFAIYQNTTFSTNAYEFMNTYLFQKFSDKISIGNFLTMPTWTYYPLVDLFFEKILPKYDADHIILIRFRSNHFYWEKDGTIQEIPDDFKQPFQANDKYNFPLKKLENYIIEKYQPYVIDLSEYYMGDHNTWDNIQGAHFELGFYHDVLHYIHEIVGKSPAKRYFNTPSLFNQAYQRVDEYNTHPFDVEYALSLFPQLVESENLLWLNILDKLNYFAPENPRVQAYMAIIKNEELFTS